MGAGSGATPPSLSVVPLSWPRRPHAFASPLCRHATYADDLSRPENPRPPENDDEDFREPADLRYPGQLESAEPSLGLDLAWIAKTK